MGQPPDCIPSSISYNPWGSACAPGTHASNAAGAQLATLPKLTCKLCERTLQSGQGGACHPWDPSK
eukprot:1128656-Prymnesium_polylepis.2